MVRLFRFTDSHSNKQITETCLKYHLIAAACALGLTASCAQAQSFVKVYGVADAGIVLESGGPDGRVNRVGSGVASGSRLGFKGKEDLGDGMSAFFVLENGYNMDTGKAGQGGLLFGRQALVGLSGAAGSISLGRQYAPYFKAMRDIVDPFCTGLAGNVQNIFPAFTRIDNSVDYQTPKWHGTSAEVLYGLGEAAGDAAKKRTIDGSATYEGGPLTLVLAHHVQNDDTGTAHSRSTLLAGRYRFGIVTAHAAYARALSISPNLASAHYGMGAVLMSQAAYAQAAEHFRIASVNAPGDLQARLKLAGCLLEIGQTDTALASLRAAIRGGPQQVYAMSLKLVLNSGRGRFWLRPSAAARALTSAG